MSFETAAVVVHIPRLLEGVKLPEKVLQFENHKLTTHSNWNNPLFIILENDLSREKQEFIFDVFTRQLSFTDSFPSFLHYSVLADQSQTLHFTNTFLQLMNTNKINM